MLKLQKLEGKRPTCWNFVSERLSQQHVMNHFETHRKVIEEKYTGARYNELQNLVEHMFSVYIERISAVLSLRRT